MVQSDAVPFRYAGIARGHQHVHLHLNCSPAIRDLVQPMTDAQRSPFAAASSHGYAVVTQSEVLLLWPGTRSQGPNHRAVLSELVTLVQTSSMGARNVRVRTRSSPLRRPLGFAVIWLFSRKETVMQSGHDRAFVG